MTGNMQLVIDLLPPNVQGSKAKTHSQTCQQMAALMDGYRNQNHEGDCESSQDHTNSRPIAREEDLKIRSKPAEERLLEGRPQREQHCRNAVNKYNQSDVGYETGKTPSLPFPFPRHRSQAIQKWSRTGKSAFRSVHNTRSLARASSSAARYFFAVCSFEEGFFTLCGCAGSVATGLRMIIFDRPS